MTETIIALIILLASGPEVVTDFPSMAVCRAERDALRERNVMAMCIRDTKEGIEAELVQIEKIIATTK